MYSLDPGRAIVPVVKLIDDGQINELLGTAFFLGSHPYAITAKHIFNYSQCDNHEKYAIVYLAGLRGPQIIQFSDIIKSNNFDIAAIPIKGLSEWTSLSVCQTQIANTEDVITYDFSTTQLNELHNEKKLTVFTPYTHKGNILCYYDSEFPESVTTHVFEVSFPGLQGASGAPICRAKDLSVVGIAVANRERDILPAQVIKIKDKDRLVEEVKYFLPTGKCISNIVIIDFLKAHNINFSFAPEISDL